MVTRRQSVRMNTTPNNLCSFMNAWRRHVIQKPWKMSVTSSLQWRATQGWKHMGNTWRWSGRKLCWSLVDTICVCVVWSIIIGLCSLAQFHRDVPSRQDPPTGPQSGAVCGWVCWVCLRGLGGYVGQSSIMLCAADVVCNVRGRTHTVIYVHLTLLIIEDLENNGWSADKPSSTCIYWPNLLCCGSGQVCIVLHVSVWLRTLCLPSSADVD